MFNQEEKKGELGTKFKLTGSKRTNFRGFPGIHMLARKASSLPVDQS